MEHAFRAVPNGTIRLQAATVAGAAPLLAGFPAGGGCQVRIWNRGSVPVSIEFGGKVDMPLPVAPTSSTGGAQRIPPGAVEVQTLQTNQRHVAVLAASGTPDVEVTVGGGL
ncbi:hypothetical protein MKK70_21265 [Methylobacterium sp. E-041]|uniref:hypothetical protein n=1 Tax=Methylobacterium sp. E-041 TaxID=2836573 RepID=UPI001FBBFAEF|nr:hypothetical protein [Methylobacterium sp. E-041]MCJ2107860.1 hypothetical protein [Methylobacterium sp. E-041]